MNENLTNYKKPHLLYLDGLRAFAAIFVVVHHVVLHFYFFETKDLTGFKKALINFFFLGHFAVDLFIVLSGFCLMIPVVKSEYQLKGGTLFFYKKRAIRIIPTYYMAIGFCALLGGFLITKKTGTVWDTSIPVTKYGILADMLFIQDCFNITLSNINYVFWSVAVETRIYIIFPLLIILYKKLNASGLLLLSVITSLILYYLLKFIDQSNNIFPLDRPGLSPYLILFTLGMVSADICYGKNVKLELLKRIPWRKTLFAVTILIGIMTKLLHKNLVTWQEVDVVVGIWAMCLLIVGYNGSFDVDNVGWINKILSWRPIVFIGTFAYSIYLIHAPMLQVISQYIIFPLHLNSFVSAMLAIVISLPVCIAFAYLFFILFERPFLNLGKKVTLKSTEANAAINPAI